MGSPPNFRLGGNCLLFAIRSQPATGLIGILGKANRGVLRTPRFVNSSLT
jgi:hypothetical protein